MAVGRAGAEVVIEVRRQFREIKKELWKEKAKPEYSKSGGYSHQGCHSGNDYSFFTPCLAPVVVYFVINAIAGQAAAFTTLGAMLPGNHYHRSFRRYFYDLWRRSLG